MHYLNIIVLPGRKANRSWRPPVDCHQLDSVVDPIAPAVPDIVTVTESLAWADGTWHAVLDVAKALFAVSLAPKNQEEFPHILQGLQYASAVFLQESLNFLPLATGGWVRI